MDDKEFKQVEKCNSVEEVLELAKANNKEITLEDAKKAFQMSRKNNNNAISDEELSNISGGSGCGVRNAYVIEYFQTQKEANEHFIFEVGQRVEKFRDVNGSNTINVLITDRRISYNHKEGFYDTYYVDGGAFHSGWKPRCWFEK